MRLTIRIQLGAVIALIELASLTLLFVLLKQEVLPDKRGVLLILLLPIAFGLHVTEEFIVPGGFVKWVNTFRPKYADTSESYYVKVNAIPGIASVLVALGAFDYAGKYSPPGVRGWLVFLTFMGWNAFFHLRGALHTRAYSPGMVTGLLLFVPLTVVSYAHFVNAGAVDTLSAAVCAAIALTIQPALDFIKRRG